MRRITILLPDLRAGGTERVALDLALALKKFECEVEFALMSMSGEFLQLAACNFPVFNLHTHRIRKLPFSFARHIRQRKPQAIIANMWPLTSAAALGLSLSGQTGRLLLVDHCSLSTQYATCGRLHKFVLRTSMTLTYRMASCVAGVSEGVARDVELLAGMPIGSVAVLHNPIPLREGPNELVRSNLEAIWNFSRGKRILAVGSLKDQKNHALLLHAFCKVSHTTATLMLVGQGQNEQMLRALARELGISNRVVFAGFQHDPSHFYATADLFVLSSDYEGFANVIVEALSFGLPVVSTDCPSGPAEILENGRWGRLTPVGDAEALARAMDEALSSEVDREALKRRAADFSPEIAARKYLDLLGLS